MSATDYRRPWRSLVLAPVGDGATRRRGTDLLRVILAALVVTACWVVKLKGAGFERAVLGFVTPPPGAVHWLVTLVFLLGSFGLIVVLGVLALVAHRPAMARDVGVAGFAAWGLSYLIEVLVGTGGGGLGPPALAHVDLHFPQPRVAVAVAVALAAVPYLARGLKRFVSIVIVLAALATVVHGSGLVTSVLASIALGWGVAAGVQLAFGTPLGLPSAADVALLLGDLGITADHVTPVATQEWGVARYEDRVAREPLAVSVYGRDARDAQLFAKVFRFVFYRDSGPTLTFTRLQQVEHEAYLTLLAGSRGANVPTVVSAARAGPSHDALLVTTPPAGSTIEARLAEQVPPPTTGDDGDDDAPGDVPTPTIEVPDAALDAVFDQVLALRGGRIAHGAIGADTVVLHGDDAGLVAFRQASSDASQDQLDRDLACALATVALAVGPERAVAAATRRVPTGDLAAALPFLQRAALSPSLTRRFRGRKAELASLRELGAGAAGVEVPKLADARRINWVTVALIAGSLIGGWALLGVLLDVGRSFDTVRGAHSGWVVLVFVLSMAVFPALSLEVLGAVVDPLPFGRVLALEIADTFVGLAGGTMAVLATRVRFFQQQGLSPTLAVSSGVLITSVSWIVKGALFLVALPFGLQQIHLDDSPTGGNARTVWLIVVAVVVVGVALGLVFAVPRWRRVARDKLRPKYSELRDQFRALRARPRKLVQIMSGALGAQLLVVLALAASLQAFGAHVSIATLLVVMTLASMLGGASPVPGGVGVVEAGLIIGLTAAGVEEEQAVAAVFVQRLFTSYLPPIAGWCTMVVMRRREYL
jgi:uncharacterized membrane protein YbhN (UPF0104 family)